MMEGSWLIHRSPGFKRDWLGDINLSSIKNSYMYNNICNVLSNVFPATESKDIGR